MIFAGPLLELSLVNDLAIGNRFGELKRRRHKRNGRLLFLLPSVTSEQALNRIDNGRNESDPLQQLL
jgi:hypothetical protein